MGRTGGGRGTNQYQVSGMSRSSRQAAAVVDALAVSEADTAEGAASTTERHGGPTRHMTWTATDGRKFSEDVPDIWLAGMCRNGMTTQEALAYWRWMSEHDPDN